MYKKNYITAIILAAGIGKRMNYDIPKQYIVLSNETILKRTITNVLKTKYIDECILVIRKEDEKQIEELIEEIQKEEDNKEEKLKEIEKEDKEKTGKEKDNKKKNTTKKRNIKIRYAIGGKERQDSAYSGLNVVSDKTDIVLFHDGVRPFIKKEIIEEAIREAIKHGSVATAVMVKDTIKYTKKGGKLVESTPRRENLRAIQTPQVFKKDIIKKAYDIAYKEEYYSTDDASLVEYAGGEVYLVEGDYNNIKITTKEDLILANAILEQEQEK